MKFSCVLFSSILLAGFVPAQAQVVPAATSRQFSITAGGMASIFQPDFADNSYCIPASCGPGSYSLYPAAGGSNQPLFGAGAYVDVKLMRWVQFEAEGRWLRFHAYQGITQDNYLIGPRIPVYRFWKATIYAKVLAGDARMNFGPAWQYPQGTNFHGNYTDIAFGGGADLKLTRRLSLRLPDFEYQYYPKWANNLTLSPYGASVGVGYKFF
ncbi:MAG: outer membrane beta-barrel protein [Terracidiphilus sp.]|jgi:hypothetical protein